MPKITVMMPVYNAEPFLDECMQSILTQTLKDIEILCIDDGSKDNSGVMLDEYASKDDRIRVIHKNNTGYGHSMNLAIREATGDYLAIVEPDDYIHKDAFKILYSHVKKYEKKYSIDFVKGNFYEFSSDKKPKFIEPFSKKYLSDKIIHPIKHLETFQGGASIWCGIYRREWITKKNICFLETPGASFQDTSFYIKCLFEADRAIFINDGIYYYRTDNQGSSVKDNSKIFAIVEELKTLEERYMHTEKEKQIINSVKIDKYFWNYNRLDQESQSAFRKEFEKIIPIIQDRKYYCEIISKNMLKELYSDFNLDYPIDLEVKYFFSRITRRIRQKWLG